MSTLQAAAAATAPGSRHGDAWGIGAGDGGATAFGDGVGAILLASAGACSGVMTPTDIPGEIASESSAV